MRDYRIVLVLTLPCGALSCGAILGGDFEIVGGGGSTAAGAGGSTAAGGGGSTAAGGGGSGASGGGHAGAGGSAGCTADLNEVFPTTADCNGCAREHCCTELQVYIEDPASGSTADPFAVCMLGADGGGPCETVCSFPVCGGLFVMPLDKGLADCLSASCCPQTEACLTDGTCSATCFHGWNEGTCCSLGVYLDMAICWEGQCGLGGACPR